MGCILSFMNKEKPLKISEFKSELECSICLEVIDQTTEALPCAHVFHSKCLNTWRNSKRKLSNNCPLCLN